MLKSLKRTHSSKWNPQMSYTLYSHGQSNQGLQHANALITWFRSCIESWQIVFLWLWRRHFFHKNVAIINSPNKFVLFILIGKYTPTDSHCNQHLIPVYNLWTILTASSLLRMAQQEQCNKVINPCQTRYTHQVYKQPTGRSFILLDCENNTIWDKVLQCGQEVARFWSIIQRGVQTP